MSIRAGKRKLEDLIASPLTTYYDNEATKELIMHRDKN